MKRCRLIPLILLCLCGAACVVSPNYKRPATAVPESFRAPEPITVQEAGSLADLKWFEVFKDNTLQELVRTALVNNHDLRDAVLRVEEARAVVDRTRSNQFPNVSAGAGL